MTQAQSNPLSDAELEQLEDLLVSDDVPADCMNMEMLDGYLAAIVSCPLPIPVERWLPAVWNVAVTGIFMWKNSSSRWAC